MTVSAKQLLDAQKAVDDAVSEWNAAKRSVNSAKESLKNAQDEVEWADGNLRDLWAKVDLEA